LGRTANIPADIGPFLGVVLGLVLVAHIATRYLARGADGVLLPVAGLLNGVGYVFIARLDGDLAGLQAVWTAVGIAAFIATLVFVRRTRALEGYRYTLMFVGIGLLLLPLVPGVGRTINGARIWVSLGPVSFQPGEFAKIVLAVFFASYLVEKREVLAMASVRLGPVMLPDLRHFGPVLLAWGASLIVMFYERDLGSSLLFFAVFVVMLWIATERASYLAVSLLLFGAGALLAWRVFSHVQVRVDNWLDPWQDVVGAGFQTVQGTFALAFGGITGTGLGLGSPGRIPAAETDFIFVAIGEELGLAGTTAVLVAFLLMVGTGLRIALQADNPFEKLLAAGLTTILGLQSFIIIGGVIRLVPLTGITLPFVSYGGSSLVANYVLLALLMRISDVTGSRAADERR
ncbi:MAG: FtsW/RodA/SpoVE family cell cycle protein, partial [Acidimicrobiia bacterium]|nr:FtsW/RodA/SpoVE family cell cycle protein [Acidimicrobiia bacterium]